MLEFFAKVSGFFEKSLPQAEHIGAYLLSVAPLLAALGTIATGAGAWATFVLISRRTIQLTWIVGFREQYAEFWRDEQIGAARRAITSDVEYEEIRGVLAERIKTNTNKLNADDNHKLDRIDRFLALLLRMHLFSKSANKFQHSLWSETYTNYWIPLITSRPELHVYVNKYWPHLDIKVRDPAKEAPLGKDS